MIVPMLLTQSSHLRLHDRPGLGVFDFELQPVKGRLKRWALELVEVAEWPGWTFGC